MTFKERMRRAWEKLRFFFYRLRHPEARKQIVHGTRGIINDVKGGVVLYVKTGRVKMQKINVTGQIRRHYEELGMIYETLVEAGTIQPDERAAVIVREIAELKEELKKLEREEQRSSLTQPESNAGH